MKGKKVITEDDEDISADEWDNDGDGDEPDPDKPTSPEPNDGLG